MTVTAAAPALQPRWIAGPWLDLLVGCGGWSLPLLAMAYTLSGNAERAWSGAFYSLALVCNYPHYMATVYRAYGRGDDRAAHRLYTVWGTGVLVALGSRPHQPRRAALVVHGLRHVESVALQRPELWPADDVCRAADALRHAGLVVCGADRARMATGLAVPQTRYSSGILAVMHSAQYLWLTQYFARREQGDAWVPRRYWMAALAGGIALFLPVPWLTSYGARVDFTPSMLIVTAIVNLHDFMIDGVVWKLRDPRVARALTMEAPVNVASPSSRRPAIQRVMIGTAIAGLILLTAVDQWRYRLASQQSNSAALQAAVGLNPYDSPAQMRLLQILVESGRLDEAREHLARMIATQPGNAGAGERRSAGAADRPHRGGGTALAPCAGDRSRHGAGTPVPRGTPG